MNTILLTVAASLMSASAGAAPAQIGEEARIPFVNFSSIRTFKAVGRDTVYFEDLRRQWYRATLFGPCLGLPFAQHIGVDNRGTHSLDRFSAIIVEGQRCQIQSLVKSGPPPRKAKGA